MTKPNLFIIGAMKSATSSLHSILNEHPNILMSAIKEPSYFVDHDVLSNLYNKMSRCSCSYDLNNYLQLFETDNSDILVFGESSTNYAKYPHVQNVPSKIFSFNPDAKLIYIIKNPIDRAISHYWHSVRSDSECHSMDDAVVDGSLYVDVSNYLMQLERFLEFFNASKIKIVVLEEFNDKPHEYLNDIFSWLGLPDFKPLTVNEKRHMSADDFYGDRWWGAKFIRRSPIVQWLRPYIPESFRSLLSSIYQVQIRKSDYDDTKVRARLSKIFIPQIEELSRITARDYDVWGIK